MVMFLHDRGIPYGFIFRIPITIHDPQSQQMENDSNGIPDP